MSVRRIRIADDEPDFQDTLRARVSQFEHGQDYAVSTASEVLERIHPQARS